MGYYCLKCKRHVEIENAAYQGVRCPYCGYRALKKERSDLVIKSIEAK